MKFKYSLIPLFAIFLFLCASKIYAQTLPTGCKGDYNANGTIDISDFAVLGQNYKKAGINCALDISGGNCLLDIVDFQNFAQVYKVTNACSATLSGINDVTSNVEYLGTPFTRGTYSRNVWDMQLWNNKIYIGTGNSSNSAPDSNAGPIPIITFNPSTNQFINELITKLEDGSVTQAVDEEQIDHFDILSGKLAIAGHDARDPWGLGNWYILDTNGWLKYRNIPGGIHVYDLVDYGGKRFAGTGTTSISNIAVSTDNGQNWTTQVIPLGSHSITANGACDSAIDPPVSLGSYRVYLFFSANGELYANTDGTYYYTCVNNQWKYITGTPYPTIFHWNGTGFVSTSVNFYGSVIATRVVHPTTYKNNMVYVIANGVNDHQWTPKGINKVDSNNQVTPISGLKNNPVIWDILAGSDGALYVLGDIRTDDTHHVVTVNKTTDLTNWTEVLRFNTTTFARSFEIVNGDFYFGLGTETTYVSPDTGKILRVKASFIN